MQRARWVLTLLLLGACIEGKPRPSDRAASDGAASDGAASSDLRAWLDRARLDGALDGGPVPTGWVLVPAGTFTMGSPESEGHCRGANEVRHPVTLTRAFELMEAEVTRAQFKAALGFDPSLPETCGPDCPVTNVSWHEAAAYCSALSAPVDRCYDCRGAGTPSVACTARVDPIYACKGYRLPTEAEWERAYRSGTQTAFYSGEGDLGSTCQDGGVAVNKIAWYVINTDASRPVKTRQPNAWGLHDMAGNVSEWVDDGSHPDLGAQAATDPWNASAVSYHEGDRVTRGGSYRNGAHMVRAAFRYPVKDSDAFDDRGFRCARSR